MLNVLELIWLLVSKSCQVILCNNHCLKLSLFHSFCYFLYPPMHKVLKIISVGYSTYISPGQLWLQCRFNFLKRLFWVLFVKLRNPEFPIAYRRKFKQFSLAFSQLWLYLLSLTLALFLIKIVLVL